MKDLRNLPQPVLDRLTTPAPGVYRDTIYRGRPVRLEARLVPVELRADTDQPTLEGYATVWDTPYEVFGGPPFGWTETIAQGAADQSLRDRDDVRFLVNHDGLPLARTKSGTLDLTADTIGLHVAATLDPRSPDVQALTSALERGDLDEMSFAFQVEEQTWDGDFTERIITKLKLFDVSGVTFPANPATHIQLASDWLDAATPTPRGLPLAVVYAIRDTL